MVTRLSNCQARQQSDQKCCTRCGLVWDMNDPEPPECKTSRQISQEQAQTHLNQIRGVIDS